MTLLPHNCKYGCTSNLTPIPTNSSPVLPLVHAPVTSALSTINPRISVTWSLNFAGSHPGLSLSRNVSSTIEYISPPGESGRHASIVRLTVTSIPLCAGTSHGWPKVYASARGPRNWVRLAQIVALAAFSALSCPQTVCRFFPRIGVRGENPQNLQLLTQP